HFVNKSIRTTNIISIKNMVFLYVFNKKINQRFVNTSKVSTIGLGSGKGKVWIEIIRVFFLQCQNLLIENGFFHISVTVNQYRFAFRFIFQHTLNDRNNRRDSASGSNRQDISFFGGIRLEHKPTFGRAYFEYIS